jgi:glycosyltransferase involved in cell wall biosynthesis
MKIALLTDGIHPYVIGGMQTHSYRLVKYLAQKKHTVYLFHCNASNYDISKLEFLSVEEKRFIHPYVIPFPHKTYFPFHYLYESYLYSKYIHQSLVRVIGEIDFIYAQGFCAWDLFNNKEKTKIPPIAVHFHGFEMFQKTPGMKSNLAKYFVREAVKYNIRKADYCVSYGGKITSLLEKITTKENIWEIPGSIEDQWLNKNNHSISGPVRFVFIGRYERRKGIEELHSAIKILLPSGGFTFDFIGPIPEQHRIESPNLRYHGQLSSEAEIRQILSGADILICPSYAEGMPNVIMEAMACGLAIVATNVGAVSLLVDKSNGWLVDSPWVNEIANTMSEVIHEKPEILEQKKGSSAEKIKNYSVEKITDSLISHIEEVKKKVSLL